MCKYQLKLDWLINIWIVNPVEYGQNGRLIEYVRRYFILGEQLIHRNLQESRIVFTLGSDLLENEEKS